MKRNYIMYGLENQVTEINRAAVKLAKASVTDRNAILGYNVVV